MLHLKFSHPPTAELEYQWNCMNQSIISTANTQVSLLNSSTECLPLHHCNCVTFVFHNHTIMHSLHEVHERNTLQACHIRPSIHQSVCIFQLENSYTDKNEIWYGCCTNGDHLQIILLNILRLAVMKQRMRVVDVKPICGALWWPKLKPYLKLKKKKWLKV